MARNVKMELTEKEVAIINAIRDMDEPVTNVWMGYVSMQDSFTKTFEKVRGEDGITEFQREKAEKARQHQFHIDSL